MFEALKQQLMEEIIQSPTEAEIRRMYPDHVEEMCQFYKRFKETRIEQLKMLNDKTSKESKRTSSEELSSEGALRE